MEQAETFELLSISSCDQVTRLQRHKSVPCRG